MTPFFKPILGFLAALLVGCLVMVATGHASELVQLPVPAAVQAIAGPAYAHCSAAGFNADSSVSGGCQTVHASACSGRGCQPVKLIYNYITRWGTAGNVVSTEACSVRRHHLPQADTITYLNGHSAADCVGVVYNPTGTVIMLPSSFDPSQQAPYFYVSTDPVTGAILANSNTAGFLYTVQPTADAPGKFY